MSSGQTTEDDTAGLKPLNKSLEEESMGKVVLPIMHFKQIQYFQETSPFSSNAPTRSPSPRRKCRLPPVDEPATDKQDQDHAGEEEKCPKVADILEEPTRKMELAEGGLAITDKQVNEGSVETPPLPTLSPSTQSFAPCAVLAKVSDQQHLPRPKDLPLATPGDVQQIHPSPVPTRAKVSPRQVKTPVRVVPKAFQPPAITGVAHLERPHALQSSAVASPIGTYLPPGPPPGPPGPLGPPGPQPGTKLPVPSFPVEATKGTTGTLLPMGSPPVPKSIDLTQRPASSPVDTSKPISPASQAAWRKNVLWANHTPYGNRAVSERPPSAAAGPAPVQPVQPKSSATPVPSPPVSSGKELPGTGVSPRPPSGRPLATPASSGHQLNGLGKTPSGMQSQGGLPPPKAAASSSSSGPMPAQSSSSRPARSSTAGVEEDEYEMYSYTGSSRSSSPERKRRSRSNSSSRSSYARSCSPNSRKRGNDFLPDISVQCTPRAETANPANPANPQSLGTNQDRQDGQGLQNEQTLQARKGDAKETEDIQKPESTWRLLCGLEKIWCLSTLHFANLRATCSQPKCFTLDLWRCASCFVSLPRLESITASGLVHPSQSHVLGFDRVRSTICPYHLLTFAYRLRHAQVSNLSPDIRRVAVVSSI